MNKSVEGLWLRLQTVLKEFADKLTANDPRLIQDIGRTANEAFLLRVYLSLRRRGDGDEVAITVDVRKDGQRLAFESDVCTNEGEVIATGPSAVIPLSEATSLETGLNNWLNEFDQFLQQNERIVMSAVSKLT